MHRLLSVSFPMTRELFSNRDFAALWASTSISHLGSTLGALALTALVYLDATAPQMGILVAATTAPALLVALLAGVWVDRLPRRVVLIFADIGRFVVLLTVPAAALLDRLVIEQLYVVAFVEGCLEVVFSLAYRSALPSIVPPERLVDANAGLRMSESVADGAGPTLGGAVVQVAGGPVAVLLDALTFLASGLLLGRMRPLPPKMPATRQPAIREALAGVKTAVRDPALRAVLGVSSTFGFFVSFIFALFALRALREVGLSPVALGLLAVGSGLGSLVGAGLVGTLTRRWGVGACITVAYVLATLADLTMPLASGPPWVAFAVLFAGAFLSDLFYVVHGVSAMSLRQALTPPEQLGRVNATFIIANRSLRPLGAVVAGLAAGAIGVQAALLVGGAGMVGASAWLIFSPLPRLRSLPAPATA